MQVAIGSEIGVARVTCRQFILDFLADYLDAKLSPDVAADLEHHLAICPPCVAYMNTYKKTQELVGRTAPSEMPPEMKAILRKFLLEQLTKGKP
jgi:anti-sigma factor RsiW